MFFISVYTACYFQEEFFFLFSIFTYLFFQLPNSILYQFQLYYFFSIILVVYTVDLILVECYIEEINFNTNFNKNESWKLKIIISTEIISVLLV